MLSPADVQRARSLTDRLLAELGRAILGQAELLELVAISLLARGHLLLEGLPGLGKTELIKSLSRLLGLSFRRVQFTPDLLPGDIIGSPILEEVDGRRRLVFHTGPIFANLVLADEINRASPKTQSALLEAMQERRVTVLGETHPLPFPFFVLATQNPIELEGTYPLPEAQLDRFTFKINVPGVSSETLQEIITTRRQGEPPELTQVLSESELVELFDFTDAIHLPTAVANYIARLVSATHPTRDEAPDEVRRFVKFGASPRAAIALAGTARAAALIHGKPNVGFDEVRRVARSVLGHRLILDYAARLEGWDSLKLVDRLLAVVPDVSGSIPEDLRA
ncbi:MAG: AAA family ATPase [Planctomycetaceae bacterium]|nr:AAA family ATPase [Planctomycetaceae bacterium]